ncbi:hypothetical protein C8R47DRAFT_1071902 [Mycena vitilis]|nr:hypothetical protein C8R47DRAFT_1071902 [Mycena vitilis]
MPDEPILLQFHFWLDRILGAWLIGVIVSAVLFGVTCLQIYLYFTKHCVRDPVFVKAFVAVLLSLDALHLALTSHALYYATVTNFGDEFGSFGRPAWSLSIQSAIGCKMFGIGRVHFVDLPLVLLSTQVQLFYAFRIYKISNERLAIPIIITKVGLSDAFGHCGVGVQSKIFVDTKGVMPYLTIALSLGVSCDVLIAAAMVYNLLENKSQFQRWVNLCSVIEMLMARGSRTNKAIDLLVSYSVSSGALTMVFAICSLGAWATSYENTDLIYTPFFFTNVRLYGLSFMTMSVPSPTSYHDQLKDRSSLNSREHVREQMFSSHAMVTIPSDGSNAAAVHKTLHEDLVFDDRSKNTSNV